MDDLQRTIKKQRFLASAGWVTFFYAFSLFFFCFVSVKAINTVFKHERYERFETLMGEIRDGDKVVDYLEAQRSHLVSGYYVLAFVGLLLLIASLGVTRDITVARWAYVIVGGVVAVIFAIIYYMMNKLSSALVTENALFAVTASVMKVWITGTGLYFGFLSLLLIRNCYKLIRN